MQPKGIYMNKQVKKVFHAPSRQASSHSVTWCTASQGAYSACLDYCWRVSSLRKPTATSCNKNVTLKTTTSNKVISKAAWAIACRRWWRKHIFEARAELYVPIQTLIFQIRSLLLNLRISSSSHTEGIHSIRQNFGWLLKRRLGVVRCWSLKWEWPQKVRSFSLFALSFLFIKLSEAVTFIQSMDDYYIQRK